MDLKTKTISPFKAISTLIVFLSALIFLASALVIDSDAASSDVKVTMPTFQVVINDKITDANQGQYPLLVYKDITYFPMTYNYCRAMDLTSDWVSGQGLFIAVKPNFNYEETEFKAYPLQKGYKNTKTMTAVKVNYPVFIDGEKAPYDELYPLLNFRGVTYFPMTWEKAHELLGWDLKFVPGKFTVYTVTCCDNSDQYTFSLSEDKDSFYLTLMKTIWQKTIRPDGTVVYHDGRGESLCDAMSKTSGEWTRIDISDKEKASAIAQLKPYEQTELKNDRLNISNSTITLDGQPVTEIIAEAKAAGDASVSGIEQKLDNGMIEYEFSVCYQRDIPAPYTPVDSFIYVKTRKDMVLIAKNAFVDRIITDKGNAYITVFEKTGYKSMVKQRGVTYKVGSDGSVECLNNLYEDYGSIKVVGKANGKIYLKMMWAPDGDRTDYNGNEDYRISAVNDGYFTYDGKSIKQVHKYIYASDSFVSPKGEIYITDNLRGNYKKLNLDQ